MKPSVFAVLLVCLLSVRAGTCVANESHYTITVQTTVISLPKDQALQFLTRHHLESEPDQGFLDLLPLVDKGVATSVANPAVTTTSGQRAFNESGTTKLEVETILSPSIRQVDTTLIFNFGGAKISTSFVTKSGEAKFLGAFDSPDAAIPTTSLVFVRVSVSKE